MLTDRVFGSYVYIVQTHYRDENGDLHKDSAEWQSIENAKTWYNLRTKYIGKEYNAGDWIGIIDSVFVFRAQMCEISEQ